MGPFNYSETKTSAKVNFQAHKFPYTASVYYQCNVRLCLKHTGGCDDVVSGDRVSSFNSSGAGKVTGISLRQLSSITLRV